MVRGVERSRLDGPIPRAFAAQRPILGLEFTEVLVEARRNLAQVAASHRHRALVPVAPTTAFSPFSPLQEAELERVLRIEGGRSRAICDRLKRAASVPREVALGRRGVRAKAAIQLRARNSLHRPSETFWVLSKPSH
jgi:hypothetical protein